MKNLKLIIVIGLSLLCGWLVGSNADAIHTPNDFTVDGAIYNTSLTANTLLCLGASKQHTTIGTVSGTNVTLGSVQASVFKSSDGSSGVTSNIVAGLVTFTIKNGLIVGVSL